MSASKNMNDEELDQRIARIRRQNEEILKRKQQIEEDRKLAEEMNAVVQLRPSKDDWPRDRTPALKLSNREMRDMNAGGDDAQQMVTEPVTRSARRSNPPSRNRGENTKGGVSPPPDPVSFLADPERDHYSENKEQRTPSTRGARRNTREFRRDGPRRGRGRGRGNYNSGSFSSPNDDAWREERYKIDEARVSRQKGVDGKWRREWDNEKIDLETSEEQLPSITSLSGVASKSEHWKNQPKELKDSYEPSYRGRGYAGGDFSRDISKLRGRSFSRNFNSRETRELSNRGGRIHSGDFELRDSHTPVSKSRSYDTSELRNHLEPNFRGKNQRGTDQKTIHEPNFRRRGTTRTIADTQSLGNSNYKLYPDQSPINRTLVFDANAHSISSPVVHDDITTLNTTSPPSPSRFITSVGDSFKIVIPNTPTGESENRKTTKQRSTKKGRYPEGRNPHKELRPRSRTSQSSFSEDEGHKNNSNKEQTLNKLPERQLTEQTSVLNNDIVPESNAQKPPLPPFKTSLPKSQLVLKPLRDTTDGEESWEDVTTSGTESVGEDSSSYTTSPKQLNTKLNSSDLSEDLGNKTIEPDDIYTPDDFIKRVEPSFSTSDDLYGLVSGSIEHQNIQQLSNVVQTITDEDITSDKSKCDSSITPVIEKNYSKEESSVNVDITTQDIEPSKNIINDQTMVSVPEHISAEPSLECDNTVVSDLLEKNSSGAIDQTCTNELKTITDIEPTENVNIDEASCITDKNNSSDEKL